MLRVKFTDLGRKDSPRTFSCQLRAELRDQRFSSPKRVYRKIFRSFRAGHFAFLVFQSQDLPIQIFEKDVLAQAAR